MDFDTLDKSMGVGFHFDGVWQIGEDDHTPAYKTVIKLCRMMLLYIQHHLISSWITMSFLASIFFKDVQYWLGLQLPAYVVPQLCQFHIYHVVQG